MTKKRTSQRGYPGFPTRFFMYLSSIEGGFSQVYQTLTESVFLTILALSLGAEPKHLGFLAAIPHMTQIFQLIGAYLVEATGHRKRVVIAGASISRILWLLIPFLYWMFAPEKSVLFFLGIVVASSCLELLANNAWTTWMADLIPETLRGRYFGFRHGVLAAVTITITFFGGLWLDYGGARFGQQAALTVLLIIAVLGGYGGLVLLTRQPDIPRPPERIAPRIKDLLLSPVKNRSFRRSLEFFLAWNVAIGFTKVFFDVHMIQVLKMSYLTIGLFHTIKPLMGLFLFRRWGKIIDTFQIRSVLLIAGVVIGLLPILWIIPTAGNLNMVWLIGVLVGFSWTGFNLSAYTYPMQHSPRIGRSYYLAYFSIVSGLGFIFSAIVGGWVAQVLVDWTWTFGNRTFMIHHLMFFIGSLMRFAALLLLFRMREVHAPGTLALINYITKIRIQPFPRWIRPAARKTT